MTVFGINVRLREDHAYIISNDYDMHIIETSSPHVACVAFEHYCYELKGGEAV